MRRLRGGAAVAVARTGAAAGCTDGTVGTGGAGGGRAMGGAAALAAAESLPMKGRAPRTGYDRDRFGTPWADTYSNDCGTRLPSVLRRAMGTFARLPQGEVSRAD